MVFKDKNRLFTGDREGMVRFSPLFLINFDTLVSLRFMNGILAHLGVSNDSKMRALVGFHQWHHHHLILRLDQYQGM